MKRKAIWILIVFLLLIAAIPAYVVWIVLLPHRYDPGDASTPADVKYFTTVSPPTEAQHIRVASFNQGQARHTFLRFEAPVDVCMKYAASIMPAATLVPLKEDQQYFDSSMVYSAAPRLNDLRWFDLPYTSRFWSTANGQPIFSKPDFQGLIKTPEVIGADGEDEQHGYDYSAVRVDTKRGVFYFIQSN